ncbi:MAG: acetyl-CoA carboxylase biotin carboxylase subunit [bacterium]|nr:acetyl-CoA carboxylase biotin carboxylase subunit [bacterium]
MFKKILIANRGEIALRVIFTCKEMGITTVAVYSDVDRDALHVLEADQSVCLGDAEPQASYLNIDKIIAAAKETGAEAIHPGYGFLAENAGFSERCEAEGITFIGPPAQVIRDLGDKITARDIMIKGDVPVVPGLTHDNPNPEIMAAEAEKIGYPVLIKAAAGGGGKGIRIVNSSDEMADAAVSASSEAQAAFGNGAIFLEKYLSQSRHVEFQILADTHGNVIHLLERECSIQRRHQKIIEETPSPAMTPELREQMGAAAVAAAKASGYVNAGTVEFLLDRENNFYFLEVNTRLQVEHPITEMITGVDLVRQQLEVAAGSPLSLQQEDIVGRGHAIECRIYAEDPANDFFPSPGKIEFMKEPSGPGIRNDCGIYSGFTVPVEYDPILSKLVTYSENREKNIDRMIRALEDYVILGVKSPIPFLIDILSSEPFKSGETYTNFIPEYFSEWKPSLTDHDIACIAYIVDELSAKKKSGSIAAVESETNSPWKTLGNWKI